MHFEVHHMEGFDPEGRMFNRDLAIDVGEDGYFGSFRYEGLSVHSSVHQTIQEVLAELTKKLQKKAFSELKTRLNFREDRYFAERAKWVTYDSRS